MAKTIPALQPALCGLMPHAPILLPAVAGTDILRCRRSSEACAALAERLVASSPDRVFLVSPHAPRTEGAFGLREGVRLCGGFGLFGAPGEVIDLPNDREAVRALAAAGGAQGVRVTPIPRSPLDHGAAVPLWFLARAGWHGPTSVAALPAMPDPGVCASFGEVVSRVFAELDGRVALIASGDMTHRAKPGAPAGHDPRGVKFDEQMTGLVRDGRLRDVATIDHSLRSAAAEDSVDSTTVIGSALSFAPRSPEVLSYEHPFGVGYLVAVFHDGSAT